MIKKIALVSFMKIFVRFLFILFIVLGSEVGLAQYASLFLQIGESITLSSKVLMEDRKVNVYIPESYNDNVEKRYPVIYL